MKIFSTYWNTFFLKVYLPSSMTLSGTNILFLGIFKAHSNYLIDKRLFREKFCDFTKWHDYLFLHREIHSWALLRRTYPYYKNIFANPNAFPKIQFGCLSGIKCFQQIKWRGEKKSLNCACLSIKHFKYFCTLHLEGILWVPCGLCSLASGRGNCTNILSLDEKIEGTALSQKWAQVNCRWLISPEMTH